MLYHLSSNIGYTPLILNVLYFTAVVSGLLIIVNKNPIISVLFLICLFFSVACYLISIGLEFIGLSYLLIYVGAVSILFLFILMLINVRISELLSESSKTIPFAIIAAISFSIISENLLPYSLISKYSFSMKKEYNSSEFVTYFSWDKTLSDSSHISSLGNVLYTNYSIWLLIVCVILLLAMIGIILVTVIPNSKPNN